MPRTLTDLTLLAHMSDQPNGSDSGGGGSSNDDDTGPWTYGGSIYDDDEFPF